MLNYLRICVFLLFCLETENDSFLADADAKKKKRWYALRTE